MATVINPLFRGAYSTFFVTQGTMGDIIQARGFDRIAKPIPDYLRPKPAWIQAIYTWYALPETERQKYNEYAETTGYSGFQFYTLDYVNLEEEPSTLPPVTMPITLEGDLDDAYTDTPHINLVWWIPEDTPALWDIRRWCIYRTINAPISVSLDTLYKVIKNVPVHNPITDRYYQLLLRDYDIYDRNTYRYVIQACNIFPEQSDPSNTAAIPFFRR